MQPLRSKATFARSLVVAALCAAAAHAHADCLLRDLSAAEKQFVDRLSAALVAAMPAAPADMGLPAAPRAAVGSACKETPAGELEVNASATYRFRMQRTQADQVAAQGRDLQGRIDALKALPPEAKGEFDALEARRQAVFRDARRADKEGNKPLASQKYKEAMAIEAQRDAVRKRHLDGVRAQTDPLEAQLRGLPRSSGEFEVVLQANRFAAQPRDHELDLKLGTFAPHGKPFAVRSLQALVAGPQPNGAQRAALIAAFDQARLQALLDQPLPDAPAPAAWRIGGPQELADTPNGAQPQPAVQANANAPAPAAQPSAAAPAADTAQQAAKDTVNKLRGLFGR
ncbi:MAG: hypothetical protein KJZ98_08220 [Burkholderiaceae bacterium]|jgi:hypothetical protein|nr:hypothetical protein [Burkholderiaceae bacterium]MEB2350774.1 hypothetical protein [Burkholderiaceae bacterium]